MTSRRRFLVSMGAVTLGVVGCQPQSPQSSSSPSPRAESVSLYGAGATFPSFLYLKWFSEYSKQHPTVAVSYQPIGSAAGIQQFVNGTVDFGATDVPLTDEQIGQVKRGAIALPMTAGSIAVVYNLPGIEGLKIPRQVLPEIFLGKIKRWDDPVIATANPGVALPAKDIILVHRSDGSGTTAVFTAHLSAISPEWKSTVGTGFNVEWKAGIGIKDNAGISAQIQQAEGTIGYVEYAFAKQLKLSTAALENQAGKFVQPTDKTSAAALATVKLSDDLRGSVPDPEGENSYPIVTYSWLLVYKQYDEPSKAAALKDIIQWGLKEGQQYATELGYVPLPADVVEKTASAVGQIA
ncbi:phosphate ABC transporter substrate-binding protein, PhoT family [Leptolyngbyaceae cyanobacterium JSC-12]|nr:phosphate ABC transporter substrate-binding protein, PhoT family [Leptolyngbyaceae cyanobacterium JSC-12]